MHKARGLSSVFRPGLQLYRCLAMQGVASGTSLSLFRFSTICNRYNRIETPTTR